MPMAHACPPIVCRKAISVPELVYAKIYSGINPVFVACQSYDLLHFFFQTSDKVEFTYYLSLAAWKSTPEYGFVWKYGNQYGTLLFFGLSLLDRIFGGIPYF